MHTCNNHNDICVQKATNSSSGQCNAAVGNTGGVKCRQGMIETPDMIQVQEQTAKVRHEAFFTYSSFTCIVTVCRS